MTAVVDATGAGGAVAPTSTASSMASPTATPMAAQPVVAPRVAPTDSTSPSPTDSPSSSPTDSPAPSPTDTTSAPVDAPSTDSVFVVQSAASGSSGTFIASPLTSSASWSVGLESGTLNYSYPVSVPAPMGGASPRVALDYDSGSIDGRTSSTNPQASMFGMGWDYQPGFIEREYDACNNQGEGGSYPDECYVSSHQNVTLSLNGRSMHLIFDGTTWRMQDDPGWSVTNATGASNGDKNGEFWVLKSPDGTVYYFGRNYGRKQTGQTATPTNSTWTLPVWKWDTTCAVTLATPCTKAWRWNLDYVIDANNNATAYYYTPETNAYKAHNGATATAYTRGGHIASITYGYRDSDVISSVNPVDQVLFNAVGRCVQNADGGTNNCPTLGPANATSYPDTPVDQVCVTGSTTCTVTSPTFFETSMIGSVVTQVLTTGSTYTSLDKYDLRLNFPDPDDTGPESPTLWLSQVTHTGLLGGTIALQPMILYGASLPNRVADGSTGFTPVDQWRVSEIFNETGGEIAVNYGTPDGCNTALADHSKNTADCFPVNWVPEGSSTWSSGWFNKYLITRLGQYVYYAHEVASSTAYSPALTAEPIVTDYRYGGGAAWHKNEFQLNAGDTDVWNEYRGYRTVTVVEDEVDDGVISPTASRSVTVHTFYRGMYGDPYQTGDSPSSNTDTVTTEHNSSPDYAWLQGREAEAAVQTQGGSLVERTDTSYWTSQTASMASVTPDPAEVAVEVQPATTMVDAPNSDGATVRTHEVVDVHYNAGTPTDIANGAVVTHVDAGDISSADPEANCTSINYTKSSPSPYIIEPQLKITYSGLASGASCPGTGLMAESKNYYDGAHALNNGGASPPNVPAHGNLTCTHEYLTTAASGDCPATQVASTDVADTYVDYDVYGRVIDTTDADLHKSLTAYTPTSGRPNSVLHTSPTISQPTSHTLTSNTTLDYRGMPTQTVDNNTPANTTKMAYDALGRLIKAYAPTESALSTDTPTFIASYDDERASWSTVETKNLIDVDSGGVAHYRDTWTYLDGWERTREVHTLPYGGSGHLTVQTRYDDRGEVAAATSPYPVDAPINAGMDYSAANTVPLETRYSYDYLHRQVTSTRTVLGAQSWGTTTMSYAADQIATTPPAPAPKVTTTIDAWGRPLVSQEDGQTDLSSSKLTYGYDSLGRLTSVADAASNMDSYVYDLGGRRTSSTDADAGTTTVSFDAVGNVTKTIDQMGLEVDTTYDELNRPTAVSTLGHVTAPSFPAGTLATYTYDKVAAHGLGLLDSTTVYDLGNASSGPGTAWTTRVDNYDANGRPTSTSYVLPAVSGQSSGSTYTYTAGYNPDGQVASLGYPAVGGMAAETLTPTYEDTGGSTGLPVSELVQGQSVVDGYTGVDQLASRAYDASSGYVGSTTDRLYGYDSLERLSSVQTIVTQRVSGMPTQVQNDSYSYDNANNITDIVDSTGTNQQTCFNYDGLDRLTKAWTQATATGHCATYDPNAQLSPAGFNQQYTYADDGTPTSRTDLGVVTTFSDGGAVGHPHAIVSAASTAGTNTFAYDADGRQNSRTVGGVTTALSWDPLQHLYKSTAGSTSTTYVNALSGNRIARQDPDGSTTIWLAGDELHVNAGVVTDTRYYSFAGSTVAMKAESGHLTWLMNDGQNSRQVTVDDANGNATRTYYAPYGAQRAGAATLPTDQGFLGRVTDSATGLLQDGARYYDPTVGQFLSPDPLADRNSSAALLPYGYAADNPVAGADPSGLMNQPEGSGGAAAGQAKPTVMPASKHVYVHSDNPNARALVTGFQRYVAKVHADLDYGSAAAQAATEIEMWSEYCGSSGVHVCGFALSLDFFKLSQMIHGSLHVRDGMLEGGDIPALVINGSCTQGCGRAQGLAVFIAGGLILRTDDVSGAVQGDPGEPGGAEAKTPIYRGVASDHHAFDDAREGVARPGDPAGSADPDLHNAGFTPKTRLTSWSTSRQVAEGFAGEDGVVLETSIEDLQARGIPVLQSPDNFDEGEVLVEGIVDELSVSGPGGR